MSQMNKISPEIFEEIKNRIVGSIHPEKIILFGSLAWGNPGEASDVDLFIIVPKSKQPAYRRAREVHRCLRGIGIPVDVIVQTHDEVERSKRVATSLARIVLEQGRVLYG